MPLSVQDRSNLSYFARNGELEKLQGLIEEKNLNQAGLKEVYKVANYRVLLDVVDYQSARRDILAYLIDEMGLKQDELREVFDTANYYILRNLRLKENHFEMMVYLIDKIGLNKKELETIFQGKLGNQEIFAYLFATEPLDCVVRAIAYSGMTIEEAPEATALSKYVYEWLNADTKQNSFLVEGLARVQDGILKKEVIAYIRTLESPAERMAACQLAIYIENSNFYQFFHINRGNGYKQSSVTELEEVLQETMLQMYELGKDPAELQEAPKANSWFYGFWSRSSVVATSSVAPSQDVTVNQIAIKREDQEDDDGLVQDSDSPADSRPSTPTIT